MAACPALNFTKRRNVPTKYAHRPSLAESMPGRAGALAANHVVVAFDYESEHSRILPHFLALHSLIQGNATPNPASLLVSRANGLRGMPALRHAGGDSEPESVVWLEGLNAAQKHTMNRAISSHVAKGASALRRHALSVIGQHGQNVPSLVRAVIELEFVQS
jgi:hypothetical protein